MQQENKNRENKPNEGGQMQQGNRQSGDETPIYVSGDTTLQTPQEAAHDKSLDPRQDDTIDVSKDDLRETKADRLAGSDRAGTAERKDNSNSEEEE